MKKKILMMIAVSALFLLAAGCGKKEEPADEYVLRYSGRGEIVDTGMLKAVCPTGWTNTDAYDFTRSTLEPVNYILEFVKGGTSAAEDKPVLRIVKHSAEDTYTGLSRDIYTDVSDVQKFTAGSYTWTGFSAVSGGERFVYITAMSGDGLLEAWLWPHPDGKVKAAITDQDVFTALESIVVEVKE